jgi:p-aminobenzoyl-glutamate transporter AbgT
MNLDNDLKRALRRESPPAGFAERLMARIDAAPGVNGTNGRLKPAATWWRAAAASVTLAALLGGFATHRVIERRRGERAREELLRALSIAAEKVQYAQQEVRGIGSR